MAKQKVVVTFVSQHGLQEVEASKLASKLEASGLATEVIGQAPTNVVTANSLDTNGGGQGPDEDTSYLVEAFDYFSRDTEVITSRISYTMATVWANYCSNSILEGQNLGG